MSLKLPEVLPYDVVDDLIDSSFIFTTETWEDEDGTTWTQPMAARSDGRLSNFGRTFFSFIRDSFDSKEDEEGYILWRGSMECHVWTAKELTEAEIDEILAHL